MSAGNQIDSSIPKFTAIFEIASNDYKTLTGQDLGIHPVTLALEGYSSPNPVLEIFRKQTRAFDKFRKGDDKLMAWLTPLVNILFTLSAALEGTGLAFSPAKTIFAGICILLGATRDAIDSYETLVNHFEYIHIFIQRLNDYTTVPLTPAMTELLGKIMAQVLSTLALSTKDVKDRRIKKFLKRLMGKKHVQGALQRLDMLTKEENLVTAAQNSKATHHAHVTLQEFTHRIDNIEEDARNINDNVQSTRRAMDDLQRNLLREKILAWLSPPNPHVNHNVACDTHHDGTAAWFIQSSKFDEWKKNGSLLWICGTPGSGKTVLCSAIIEDLRHMMESRSALVAFYYFDSRDSAKRDVRGLLSSLLLQLRDSSDECRDTLYHLYKGCRNGLEQPSEAQLAQCLKAMIDLPGQVPVYIILDALDECLSSNRHPPARETTLNFLQDLVLSEFSKLFICVFSRPVHDITTLLNPLTSPSRRVYLHEEDGQRDDIKGYIRTVVYADGQMRRWREEDKELVISVLSERANGMFRWAFCQLEQLHRCFPTAIRRVLDELPATLDGTYERALRSIHKEKRKRAHRVFLCIAASIRPFQVEELAEIFAIEFDPNTAPNLVEGWRPDDPEDIVLSACSSLVTIMDDSGSKTVQFSHSSIKEILTSDRLRSSEVGIISYYHVPLPVAHTILARACLTVLLQLDENVGKKQHSTSPLASYAAQYWLSHTKFGDVESRVQDVLEHLFNPRKPCIGSWIWMHMESDPEWPPDNLDQHPSPPLATPLYYAALCGLSLLAKHLIITHAEDVNATNSRHGTPLHAALRNRHPASDDGRVEVIGLLLEHGADVNARDDMGWTPLDFASSRGFLEVTHLLLKFGANVKPQAGDHGTPLHLASQHGHLEIVRLLLDHGADVLLRGDDGRTALEMAVTCGHDDVAQVLSEHGGKGE